MNIQPKQSVATPGRSRRTVVSVAIAVIATIPIAAGASGASNGRTSADTTESTLPTTASPEDTADTLDLGADSWFDFDADVRLTYTFPEGWENTGWGPSTENSDPGAGTIIMPVGNIFSDPCQSVEVDPPPGPTVDDLVAAFASVPALNATATIDVTVDGFHGQQIEFTVPDYTDDECKNEVFALFQYAEDAGRGPSYFAQRPHQYLRLWILDIDGTRLVIAGTYYPATSEQDRDGLDTVLNSIQIDVVEAESSGDDDPVETSAVPTSSVQG